MMRILSVSEIRALESTANMAGHSYARMMELAGQGVARAIIQRMSVRGRRVLVLVGPRNNGGDGLVAARFLSDAGANVTAYLTRPRDPAQDEVFRKATEHNVTILPASQDAQGDQLRYLVTRAHVLVDALLGTGVTPPLRGVVADVLRTVRDGLEQAQRTTLTVLNRVPDMLTPRPFLVAVDTPSGIDLDTGACDELTLSAHLTVTFASPKWGHFRLPGAEKCGELVVADIGIPENIHLGKGPHLATVDVIREWLPPRPLNAHKGTFGSTMIVAGSVNYTGAAVLAASAAVRAGAGLVTLAIPSSLHAAIVPVVPEATYLLLPHSLGVSDARAVPLIWERLARYSALLVGPGLTQSAESSAFVRQLLGLAPEKRSTGFVEDSSPITPPELPPLVIDADGLNILSQVPQWHEHLPPRTILTPHPGEMSRLTGLAVSDIQDRRLELAAHYAAKWGHVLVLKGAFTVIASPEHDPMVLPFANPGLSSAGTGDVLAGTIAALLGQGLPPFRAAVVGAYLHSLAGEIACRKLSVAGIAAGDIVRSLAKAWQYLHWRQYGSLS